MSAKQHIAACFDVLWIVQTRERVVYNPRERDLFRLLLFGSGVKNTQRRERAVKRYDRLGLYSLGSGRLVMQKINGRKRAVIPNMKRIRRRRRKSSLLLIIRNSADNTSPPSRMFMTASVFNFPKKGTLKYCLYNKRETRDLTSFMKSNP